MHQKQHAQAQPPLHATVDPTSQYTKDHSKKLYTPCLRLK